MSEYERPAPAAHYLCFAVQDFSFQSPSETELPLATSWEDDPASQFTLSCIDFELDENKRPSEIGLAKINLGTGHLESAFWTRLNGAGGCLQPLYPKIRDFLRDGIMLAHNKATERRCLFIGLMIPPPSRLWIDSLNVFRGTLPLLRHYALTDVVSTLQVDVASSLVPLWPEATDFGPHNALWDAAATGLALYHLLAQNNLSHLTLRQVSQIMPRQGLRPSIARDENAPDWNAPIAE